MDDHTAMTNTYRKLFLPNIDIFTTGGEEAIRQFSDSKQGDKHLVIIPQSTLYELQRIANTKMPNPAADSAHDMLNYLKKQRIGKKQNIITLDNNLSVYLSPLETFEKNAKKFKGEKLRIITNQPAMLIDYQNRGYQAEETKFDKVDPNIIRQTIIEVDDDELLSKLMSEKQLHIKEVEDALNMELFRPQINPIRERKKHYLYMNQFLAFPNETNTTYARVTGNPKYAKGTKRIVDLENITLQLIDEAERSKMHSQDVIGIKPKNMEQAIAFHDILLNQNISIGFIVGGQGSGKSLITYAAGMQQVLLGKGHRSNPENYFSMMRIIKPDNTMGDRQQGFLPGNNYEKNRPHLESFRDAHKETNLHVPFLKMLQDPIDEHEYGKRDNVNISDQRIYLPKNNAAVVFEYSGYLRGRTFMNSIIFVDEAQNFTQREMRDIIGRTGDGTKIIIAGDHEQIDSSNNTTVDNGLIGAINHYLGKPYASGIQLTRNYRSVQSDDSRNWKVY